MATFTSLVYLGTSSGAPTRHRNVSASCLSIRGSGGSGSQVWLMDCGEGTQQQLSRCPAPARPHLGSLRRIFITHLHGDHCYGLPGLLCSLSTRGIIGGEQEKEKEKEKEKKGKRGHGFDGADKFATSSLDTSVDIEIVGPMHLGRFLRGALSVSQPELECRYRVTELLPAGCDIYNYRRQDRELAEMMAAGARGGSRDGREDESNSCWPAWEAEPEYIMPNASGFYEILDFQQHGVQVRAVELKHRLFSLGFVITEPDRPGVFMAEQIASKYPLIPPKEYSKLRVAALEGLPFEFHFSRKVEEGEGERSGKYVVQPTEVLGAPNQGRTFLHLGDTCCSNSVFSISPSFQADFVSHECTFDDANEEKASQTGHSTARMAGRFAASVRCRHLFLTHLSARFSSRKSESGSADIDILESQAREGYLSALSNNSAADNNVGIAMHHSSIRIVEDFDFIDLSPWAKDAK